MTKIGKDIVLHYPDAGVTVDFMRLHPKDPADWTFGIHFWVFPEVRPMDASTAITALQCNKA